MPTQEERLNTLEQAIHETNMAVTALTGAVGSQERDIKRLLETAEAHTALLDRHTTLLTEHGALLHEILARLPGPPKT